jgi:hypothetical protein
MRTKLTETLNNPSTNHLSKAINTTKLKEEIKQCKAKRHNQLRLAIHTKYHLENKTIGKTWIQANKEKNPETHYGAFVTPRTHNDAQDD